MGDYPPEAVAEIVEVLQWLQENPRVRWKDMPGLRTLYKRWRDVLRHDRLINNDQNQWLAPTVTGFGLLFLMKHSPTAGSAAPPAPKSKASPRGRPRGSHTAEKDLKLFLDWKAAHQTTRITKQEFLRKRGLAAHEMAAIERGRAHARRKRLGQN
jgi:hypothetical protein